MKDLTWCHICEWYTIWKEPYKGHATIKVMQSNSHTPTSTNVSQALQSKQAFVTPVNRTHNDYTPRLWFFSFFFSVLKIHCKITWSRVKEIKTNWITWGQNKVHIHAGEVAQRVKVFAPLVWRPQFCPRDPHDRWKELPHTSCPLTTTRKHSHITYLVDNSNCHLCLVIKLSCQRPLLPRLTTWVQS